MTYSDTLQTLIDRYNKFTRWYSEALQDGDKDSADRIMDSIRNVLHDINTQWEREWVEHTS
jgi:hypothetical protein